MIGDSPTLYSELIRRGLPADYARRTADELDDHRADLLEDLRAKHAGHPEAIADERLGETRKLAKRIARDYQRRSIFGRWPLISFVLLPPVILNLAFYAGMLLIVGIAVFTRWASGAGLPGENPTGRNVEFAWAFYFLAVGLTSFAIPAALMWWYGRIALSRVQSRAYLLVASLAFGLMNGLIYHVLWIDPDNADRAHNGFGLMLGDVPSMTAYFLKPIQAAQLAVPVVVGVVMLWRDERRRREALLARSGDMAPRLAA